MTQNMIALSGANDMRRKIAQLRASVRDDWRVARDALLDPQDWMLSVRLGVLLRSVERVGPAEARKIAFGAGVPNLEKRLGEMTDRQRRVVADRLSAKKQRTRRAAA